MTPVSAGHIILTPTQPVGSVGHSGNRTRDLLTRSRALGKIKTEGGIGINIIRDREVERDWQSQNG